MRRTWATVVVFILLINVLLVTARQYTWPLIQDSDFSQKSSTSIGIRGRVTPLWFVDEHRNFTYFVYGSFIVKYDMTHSKVLEWIMTPQVARGCVLNQWKNHVVIGVQTDMHLIIYKYQENSLLEEPVILTVDLPGIGNMFGKLIMDGDNVHAMFGTNF
jgi:hypothetical protein